MYAKNWRVAILVYRTWPKQKFNEKDKLKNKNKNQMQGQKSIKPVCWV